MSAAPGRGAGTVARGRRRWGIADAVIFTGMAVNAVVIALILYFYVL